MSRTQTEETAKAKVLALLFEDGWTEDGVTQGVSFKTATLAYGGGSVINLGGRTRLKKGAWRVTVGQRSTFFYRKPDNPEMVAGQGVRRGRKTYTFKDWDKVMMDTRNLEGIRRIVKELKADG